MAIDPNIPLQVQTADPIGGYAKGLTLRSLDTENQMKSLQLEQLKSQLMGQQTLAKMMGDPSKVTMEGGIPSLNPQALTELIKTNPQAGIDQAKLQTQMRESVFKMSDEQAKSASDKLNLAAKLKLGPISAYDQVMQQTNNPQAATQAAIQARNQSLPIAVQGGILTPEEAQQKANEPFDINQYRSAAAMGDTAHQAFMEAMSLRSSQQRDRALDIQSEKLEQGNKRIEAMIGLATGKIGGSIDQGALDAAADRYNVDGTLPPLGMGRSGQNVRTQILNRAAERAMQEGGDTGSRASQLGAKATASGLTQLSKQKTMVSAFEKTATMNADLALEASSKVDRTGVTTFNKWLQAGRTATGSVEAAQFNALNETFVNEYAKVMSGSMGNTPVSDQMRQHAHELLNTSHTDEQYKGIVEKLKLEMKNRMKGFDQEIEETKKSLGSKQPQEQADKQTIDTQSDYSHLWGQ